MKHFFILFLSLYTITAHAADQANPHIISLKIETIDPSSGVPCYTTASIQVPHTNPTYQHIAQAVRRCGYEGTLHQANWGNMNVTNLAVTPHVSNLAHLFFRASVGQAVNTTTTV